MSSDETRQAKALEGIERYVKQLVPIFETINTNLVEFAKLIRKNEANALSELNEKVAPEGYEFVKEGLNYEEMEERSAELLRNNPVSQQIPKEGE